MTCMLASVRSADEARLMVGAGADVVDLKEPAGGVLGALPLATVREVITELEGCVEVSATVGDVGGDLQRIGAVADEMTQAGVDIVKVGLFDQTDVDCFLDGLAVIARRGIRMVLVTFAEFDGFRIDSRKVAAAGLAGIMVDTAKKGSGSLVQKVPLPTLAKFVRDAHEAGLISGLAGALRAEDVSGLLPLQADYLGFRTALCKDSEREQHICIRRAQVIRSLIPGNIASGGN